MNGPLLDFVVAADLSRWTGLPILSDDDVREVLGVDLTTDWPRPGALGDQRVESSWVGVVAPRFAGGLRVWLDESGTPILLDGRLPRADDGGSLTAPDLGTPELVLDASLSDVVIAEGERVHARRGLALRVGSDDSLLAVIGFAPTTAEDYLARLRPAQPAARPLSWGAVAFTDALATRTRT
jgi:hypothetical protein